jgi:arginase
VRSFEQGEARLLKNLGVRIFFADEVRERGLATVLADAVSIVSSRTAGFGISLDLDALDPAEEPGVGSPVPNGIRLADMLAGLRTLHGDRRLRAIEIVEYNPHRDRGNATARAIHDLAHSLLDVTPADAA